MLVPWERDIQSDTLWSSRLGIRVPTKTFLPPRAFILRDLLLLCVCSSIALLGFFTRFLFLLDLGSPMLKIEETSPIELDLQLIVSKEFD